tara:strand:- start:708 stop:932 length:225 start_codon:yes stop_codon:yes gene_type:complete
MKYYIVILLSFLYCCKPQNLNDLDNKINAGITKTVEFISLVTELSFINTSNKNVVESGVFNIKVGDFNKDISIK